MSWIDWICGRPAKMTPDPFESKEINTICVVVGCGETKLGTAAYCRDHYEERFHGRPKPDEPYWDRCGGCPFWIRDGAWSDEGRVAVTHGDCKRMSPSQEQGYASWPETNENQYCHEHPVRQARARLEVDSMVGRLRD